MTSPNWIFLPLILLLHSACTCAGPGPDPPPAKGKPCYGEVVLMDKVQPDSFVRVQHADIINPSTPVLVAEVEDCATICDRVACSAFYFNWRNLTCYYGTAGKSGPPVDLDEDDIQHGFFIAQRTVPKLDYCFDTKPQYVEYFNKYVRPQGLTSDLTSPASSSSIARSSPSPPTTPSVPKTSTLPGTSPHVPLASSPKQSDSSSITVSEPNADLPSSIDPSKSTEGTSGKSIEAGSDSVASPDTTSPVVSTDPGSTDLTSKLETEGTKAPTGFNIQPTLPFSIDLPTDSSPQSTSSEAAIVTGTTTLAESITTSVSTLETPVATSESHTVTTPSALATNDAPTEEATIKPMPNSTTGADTTKKSTDRSTSPVSPSATGGTKTSRTDAGGNATDRSTTRSAPPATPTHSSPKPSTTGGKSHTTDRYKPLSEPPSSITHSYSSPTTTGRGGGDQVADRSTPHSHRTSSEKDSSTTGGGGGGKQTTGLLSSSTHGPVIGTSPSIAPSGGMTNGTTSTAQPAVSTTVSTEETSSTLIHSSSSDGTTSIDASTSTTSTTVTSAVTTTPAPPLPGWTSGATISPTVRCDSEKCYCEAGRELRVSDGATYYTCYSLVLFNNKWQVRGEEPDSRLTLFTRKPEADCVPSIREAFGVHCPLPIVSSGSYTKNGACKDGAKRTSTAKGDFCYSDAKNSAVCTSSGYMCSGAPFKLAKAFCS